MRALLDAAAEVEIQDLIDKYYRMDEVHGFALGVHAEYVALYRAQFDHDISINDILLDNERVPDAWAEFCERAGFPSKLSSIYVAMYVTADENEFRRMHQMSLPPTAGDHLVLVENRAPFSAYADRATHRPLQGGISVGNCSAPIAGTLGGFIKNLGNGDVLALSCNHVLYHPFGVDVSQPGNADGGSSAQSIGHAVHCLPLFPPPPQFTASAPFNRVDVAAATIANIAVDLLVRSVGPVQKAVVRSAVAVGDDVVFVGKESDRQEARIFRLISRTKFDVMGTIYNFGNVFELESRTHLYIGTLAKPGDSGAWVIREHPGSNEMLGMLIGGNGKFALCCFFSTITSEFFRRASIRVDLA